MSTYDTSRQESSGTDDEETDDTETHRYTHTDETRRERGETHGYSSPPARDGPTNPDL